MTNVFYERCPVEHKELLPVVEVTAVVAQLQELVERGQNQRRKQHPYKLIEIVICLNILLCVKVPRSTCPE